MSSDDKQVDDSELERRSRALFEQSVASVDGRTRSKLAQARARALEEIDEPLKSRTWRRWVPAAGAAAAGVAAVTIALRQSSESGGEGAGAAAPLEDLELLAGSEDLEMMDELEFYAWLEDQSEWNRG